MARLGPKTQVGATATYVGDAHEFQIRWGGNDDPRDVLIPGAVYTVTLVQGHSQHTKVEVAGHPNLFFNSVHFEEEDNETLKGGSLPT